MTDQDKEYLRDLMAMFALNGILSCNYDVGEEPAVLAYKYADEMMEARKPQEIGIKTVRKARNHAKNNTNS
jgi:thiaminase